MRVLRMAESGFRSMTFGPRGALLATGHHRGAVRLWDAATATELANTQSSLYEVDHLAFSPDGRHLFASQWASVFHWRVEGEADSPSMIPGRTPSGRDDGMRMQLRACGSIAKGSTTVTPDSSHLVGGDGTLPLIYAWPLDGSPPFFRAIAHHGYGVSRIAIHPNGQTFATTCNLSELVSLCSWVGGDRHAIPESGRRDFFTLENPLATLRHPAFVNEVAFSPDGTLLATVAGRTVRVWDWNKGKALFKVTASQSQPRGLAFTPSGRCVATAGNDREIRLWDAFTGEARGHFAFQIGRISQVAFSSDGMIGAAGGQTRKLVLWDLDDV